MARPRTRRPKGDWVYRGMGFASDGTQDFLGTYTPTETTVSAGIAAATAWVLYDSKQYLSMWSAGGQPIDPRYTLARAGRAEGNRPKMLRVRGTIIARPSAWALGNWLSIGFRIIKCPQSDAGNMLLDADYTMWGNTPPSDAASHANARALNLWERRYELRFVAEQQPLIHKSINVPLRTRLNSNECLALYCEVQSGSVAGIVEKWLSTFVVDEGTG